jgi:beta-lactamase class D
VGRLRKYVNIVRYGNKDTSGGLPHFWPESSLTISPDEQVDFLRRLHARKLPFTEATVNTVLDIMTLGRNRDATFRGKTGTAGDAAKNIATLGWFVGSVTTPSADCFFATRITGGPNPSGRTARTITESILSTLKILPGQ